jgi:hypothetical protein
LGGDLNDRFFKIRNWKKFQHYKQRNPPWVRLYRDLLRDRAYQSLSDTCRSHLVGLFLVAGYTDNHIPEDQTWLRHELCTKVAIDLKALAASGWIEYETQDASNMLAGPEMLAPCKQDATPETEVQKNRRTEAEVQRQTVAYGEFSSVHLSEDQFGKLKQKLNGHHEEFIRQLDRYSQTSPVKFKKYKNHYAVILDWFDRAVTEGKIKPHAQQSSKPSNEEMDRLSREMFPHHYKKEAK